MTELLTAAQMRAIEQAAIASGQVTGLELMERAGQGVVQAIFEEWPELATTSHRAVVLCGPGNNGGDGFVVARLLKGWGWEVEVYLYGDPEKLPPDARVNYGRWAEMGEVNIFTMPDSWKRVLTQIAEGYDQLLVDALFGIGLSRPLEDPVKSLIECLDDTLDQRVGRYVALDVPSGLCADSGRELLSPPRKADLTVTFHRAKAGHVLDYGPYYCGRVVVADIALSLAQPVFDDRVSLLNEWHPRLRKGTVVGHKYSYGHALILSGPPGHTGAARLSARGALRVGAGLVTVACPPDAAPENAARLDAIMLKPVADAQALAGVLQDARINALCLGPGLGVGPREAGLVAVALGPSEPVPGLTRDLDKQGASVGKRGPGSSPGRPTVLDADALTLLSRDPALFSALHKSCVLTPHAGEFARLFPDIAAKLSQPATKGPAYSKVDATREAAARAGCVVLYKGPDTVIADPTGRCAINAAVYERAAPWLATAGSGDVLAGFITGLLARGFSPFDAACTGAWLHVECARSFGPGLIAEDLPEELPKVFRSLGL